MAAFVRERDREIAVRLAVGATPTRVRHFVLAATARLDGIGAAIGLAGAVVASRFLRGLLYEVEPLDPPTMVSAAMLLMVAAVVASYLPLRRATRVDTMVMLRRQ
jgi:ABC-type antimicrobial peptide transport system permease subunit